MSRRKRKLMWVWGLVFLILIIVSVTAIVLINHVFSGEAKNTTEQKNNNVVEKLEENKEKDADNKTNKEASKKEEILQYDGDDPNTNEKLSGVISYAGVIDGNLAIRINIDQYLTGGNCTLNLLKGGANIYNTNTGIETSVATSTCNGFNIPISELESGKMEIEIILESDGKRGIITGEAEI